MSCQFFNIKYRNDKQYERWTEKIEPYMIKNFRIPSDSDPLSRENSIITSLNEPIDYEALKDDHEFRNQYMGLYGWVYIRKIWMAEAIQDCKRLIADLEQEIKRLER